MDEATVHYYLRRQLYAHAINKCDACLSKRFNDPHFTFWKAFGLVMDGTR